MAENDGSGFLWFLAGLGIGAAVGILYAPTAGDETRQKIRDAAEQGRDAVKDRARQARDQAGRGSIVVVTTSPNRRISSARQSMPANRHTERLRRSSQRPRWPVARSR